MAALPYMQLYIAEYLADTQHLNGAQHGAYMLLMMNYWTRGKALPDINARLAVIARTDLKVWSEDVRPALEEFFVIANGVWSHKRIERDLEEVTSKCEQAKNNRAQRKTGRSTTPVPTGVVPREEKREEENKEPPTPFSPTIADQANAATMKVMHEAPLSGMQVRMAVEQVARHEISGGLEPERVADAMLSAWREFKANTAKLQYAWGAEKFFGEGNWKDKAAWPWKEGQAPPAKRKYLEVA